MRRKLIVYLFLRALIKDLKLKNSFKLKLEF